MQNMREDTQAQLRGKKTVRLTDEHRDYLRANASTTILLYDYLLGFMQRFNLEPMQAGRLLGEWIRETT